jgi:hypothetical protein
MSDPPATTRANRAPRRIGGDDHEADDPSGITTTSTQLTLFNSGRTGIMTDYKQAGDLAPDDVYIRRRPYRDTTQDRIYRVITTRPGNAATVVEVVVESTRTGKRRADNFFRCNRVEIVPREPQKGEESAAL